MSFEADRVHNANKNGHTKKCLRNLGLFCLGLMCLYALFIIFLIILDLLGARNGYNCMKSLGLQSGNLEESVFGGWTLECYECSTQSQILDTSKKNCLNMCPIEEGPKISHVV